MPLSMNQPAPSHFSAFASGFGATAPKRSEGGQERNCRARQPFLFLSCEGSGVGSWRVQSWRSKLAHEHTEINGSHSRPTRT
jgi:hypothetical protein